MYAESPRKQMPTIFRVSRSFCSRLSSSAMADKRHNTATAEVTSIKLSTPKPTRETLPAMIPVANAANPSRQFHPMVRYSSRLPLWAMSANSAVVGDTTRHTPVIVVNLTFTFVLLHLYTRGPVPDAFQFRPLTFSWTRNLQKIRWDT